MSFRKTKWFADHILPVMLFVGAGIALLCFKYLAVIMKPWFASWENLTGLMAQTDYVFSQIFISTVFERGGQILVLCLMNLTNLSVLYQGWFGFKNGFLFTLLCGTCLYVHQLPGVAAAICLYFPHGFFFLYLVYLTCHYFDVYVRCRAGIKEWGKLIAGMLAVFLLMCLIESTISVWLLKKTLALL